MEGRGGDSIPVSLAGEFVYCPRAFFFQYAERQTQETDDTRQGALIHRNVVVPAGQLPAPSDLACDDLLRAKAVEVGSEKLGFHGIVDVVEGAGGCVLPVEFKKGAPPGDGSVWDSDLMQVALYALLLRESGYRVAEVAIWYDEVRQKRTVQFDEKVETWVHSVCSEIRSAASWSTPPPPLVASAKCLRRSLHGVCLPDETHFLTHLSDDSVSAATPPEGASDVRRLMPARDDRLVVYVQKQGASIGLSGEVLQIREKGIVITEVRLLDVAAVSIFGNVQISAQAIRELAGRGIPLFHLSYGGWLVSVTVPTPVRSIPVRVAQFRLLADEELRLDISRRMVFAKIHNARTLLRRNLKDVDEALRRDSVQLLRVARDEALRASSLESLLGIEGRAAAIYFSNFQKMIKPNVSGEFCIAGRNRRPPRDPVNALLSFAYSLLVRDAVHALFTTGLDPYVGFFHAVRHGRPALALDLMEEFRPLLADSVVLGVLNNREISSSHFIYRAGACLLSEAGRKCLIEAWERRMDCTATHPLFGYVVSYRRILEVQARLIVRFLQREISHYQPFLTR